MNKIIKLKLRFFIVFLIIILFQAIGKQAMADNCGSTFPGRACVNLEIVNINLSDSKFTYPCSINLCDAKDDFCCELKNKEVTSQPTSSNIPASSVGTVSLTNPIGGAESNKVGITSIPALLGKIINSVLGIIGSLALTMFIYGGASWMLSGGNQEQVAKGKNILIWATIGIIIIFTSYALVKFVLTTITGA